jgi:hypothetical protein
MEKVKTEAAYIVDLFKQTEVLYTLAGILVFLLVIAAVRVFG